MAVDFTCCECGRHIVAIVGELPPEPPLCAAMCLLMPGWFRYPEIRRMIDPSHSGEEYRPPKAGSRPELSRG